MPVCLFAVGLVESAGADERQNFFEARIRPVLIEHCQECHSAETEASGGLLLDSREGWLAGGDSGAAILPGDAAASRVMVAISYQNPDLQMPPDGKLPEAVLRDFDQWISSGAFDPRDTARPPTPKQVGMLVDQAQEHWAYRDLQAVEIPAAAAGSSQLPATPVDAFIDQRLAAAGLNKAPVVSSAILVRRLYFDLLGLPPTPSELQQGVELIEGETAGYAQLVDQLLRTSHYGEHFARKWMDVARYADSVTLRGFVLPQAWRYRDYLVEAYTADLPFDQLIREQVAGDLLPYQSLSQRQRQLVATGFLVMGNTNLEQQDKTQLEMDYIDEQLEVIGRAFLGQTIGCARCHDHKFDPIPTRDYYALAGILRSTKALEHENVSKWIEQPLPLAEAEEKVYREATQELQQIKGQLAELNKRNGRQVANKKSVPLSEVSGIVVDDTAAKLVGQWTVSTHSGPFLGAGYAHDDDGGKGQKTATFEPKKLPPGQYEVRLAYTAGANRASKVMVRVFSADGETTVLVNQRQEPNQDTHFFSLGEYRFEKDGQAFVLVSNADSDGHVVIDAVQFLPLDGQEELASVASQRDPQTASDALTRAEREQLAEQIKVLDARRAELERILGARPQYLTLVEQLAPQNIPIHIRGDVHNLGTTVPRGFLTAFVRSDTPAIGAESSGRLEMADWLSSPSNPLTARVYANRVWSWLMGQGLVSSINNFGTTGTAPSHPELLDWLASELIRSGWSTKHLVRLIVLSQAYQRQVVQADPQQQDLDPGNTLYWRGQPRRLTAEALRDAMLRISGELDTTVGGSLIPATTKADYNFQHTSTRRSLYQPVFRNSLPDLFEAFDFADTSVSIGQRPRSTVATQALALLNHPWVVARANATAQRLQNEYGPTALELVRGMFQECFAREPTQLELQNCVEFLQAAPDSTSGDSGGEEGQVASERLPLLVHSLFASLDFRYLD